MTLLRSIEYADRQPPDEHPFDVPVIAQLETLAFTSPVTFFAGENGTGKSTLLEGIAAAARAVVIGGEDIGRDGKPTPAVRLARTLRLVWNRKTHRGFFLRAEDFFGFADRVQRTLDELDDLNSQYEERFEGYGKTLAQGAVQGQRAALASRYGENPHAGSHGEKFLRVFNERFIPEGLYLLDEPDTALSPQRQLALLGMLKDMVAQGAQFIIATQSPMLMAFPDATILSFDHAPLAPVPYDEVDQVVLLRSFLQHPGAYVRQL
jgi:predicted ATPase